MVLRTTLGSRGGCPPCNLLGGHHATPSVRIGICRRRRLGNVGVRQLKTGMWLPGQVRSLGVRDIPVFAEGRARLRKHCGHYERTADQRERRGAFIEHQEHPYGRQGELQQRHQ